MDKDQENKREDLRKVDFLTSPDSKPLYQAMHGRRRVKTYLIQKHEMQMLGRINKSATIWYSILAGCITALAACIWDICPTKPDDSWSFSYQRALFIIFMISGGTASFFIGKSYSHDRDEMIETIEEESDFDDTERSNRTRKD